MKRLFLLAMMFAMATNAFAQYDPAAKEKTAASVDASVSTSGGIPTFQLPPLQELLDNAKFLSPQVKQFDATKLSEEYQLKNIQSSWLRWFKANASYSYGTNDVNNTTLNQTSQTVVYNVSGITQRWWNVGASLSIPLDDIFTLHRRIEQQKKIVESVQSEKDKWYDEVCVRIIETYTEAISCMEILDEVNRNLVYCRAQYDAAEDDFAKGRILEAELSNKEKLKLDAVKQYQETKSTLIKDLYKLEILSKTPIFETQTLAK